MRHVRLSYSAGPRALRVASGLAAGVLLAVSSMDGAAQTPPSAAAAPPVAGSGAPVPQLQAVLTVGRVKAPLASVWAAYTTGEGLRSWLAPHAEFDLRLGGLMRTNYNPKGQLGDASTIENRVLAFEPERMVAIQIHRMPQGFPFPNAGPRMWTVISFTPLDAQTTEVRTASQGFDASEESQRMRAFFERGNAATMTALQRRFDPQQP